LNIIFYLEKSWRRVEES